MKTKNPRLEVQHGVADEPEEQPARIVLDNEIPVNIGRGPNDPNAQSVGDMAGVVTIDGTAGGFANDLRTNCGLCKHFDHDAWRKLHAAWGAPLASPEQKTALADITAAAIQTITGGDASPAAVGEALAMCGICHPMTEEGGQAAIVVSGPWTPCGGAYFKPRGLAEEKASSAIFDAIMRVAQGRVS